MHRAAWELNGAWRFATGVMNQWVWPIRGRKFYR